MKRKIIKIDEAKCTGCGVCIPNCHEGAIKIIDGKAKLVSDVYCDGLGACLGECPEGALSLEERESAAFDEKAVLENLVKKETVAMEDHLQKLAANGDTELHKEYGKFLNMLQGDQKGHGCPGTAHASWEKKPYVLSSSNINSNPRPSGLSHWPIQLHLVNPQAEFFRNKDVVLAADCVAYALPDFHSQLLQGKSLAIACPKLDEGQDVYLDKIRIMIDEAKINTLTVVMMEVPCCRGLLQTAKTALQNAKRKIPLKAVIIGTHGNIISDEWL